MTKQVYKQKYFSVITKNSNWKTLRKKGRLDSLPI